jgi:hypothetical protein
MEFAMSIAVMEQALAYIEEVDYGPYDSGPIVSALRAAIEQAEKQEPVAWVCEGISSDEKHSIDYQQEDIDALPVGTMLYTTPPAEPRKWVGLTNEDIIEMWPETSTVGWDDIRLIEAKLKEKNT